MRTSTTTPSNREPRARSHPPANNPIRVHALLDDPNFKRIVEYQANLKCKEALRQGKIRLVPSRHNTRLAIFTPRMDIVDDSSSPRLVATFELPGVKTDEVTLRICDNMLLIEGERRPRLTPHRSSTSGTRASLPDHPVAAADAVASGDMEVDTTPNIFRVPVQELRYGKFKRSIPMPPGTKHADVIARFQEGMLVVTWPRSPALPAGTSEANICISSATTPELDSKGTPITSPTSGTKEVALGQ